MPAADFEEKLLLNGRSCQLNTHRPLIMGILNVTPDSFFDGGSYTSVEEALKRALEMAEEGADLIDIGGESTRPGSRTVSIEEELDRVLPIIEVLSAELNLPLSIDTTKSSVADAAVAAGVEFVNDISGLTFDPDMAAVVSANGAGLFLMHCRGHPETMQQNTIYQDIVTEVVNSLRSSMERAVKAGISLQKLAIDPGIGFGKNVAGNLELLRRIDALQELERPILLGTSRKSFLGKIIGESQFDSRLAGTLASIAIGFVGGARIFRVHDVAPARQAVTTAWAISRGESWPEG